VQSLTDQQATITARQPADAKVLSDAQAALAANTDPTQAAVLQEAVDEAQSHVDYDASALADLPAQISAAQAQVTQDASTLAALAPQVSAAQAASDRAQTALTAIEHQLGKTS
jgi:predicted  nucleic acid-binding Zn-ribbon protein